jgi:amphi-Trp domain-containing protein
MAATIAVLTPEATGSTRVRHTGIVWSTHSARLHALADALARNNTVEFERAGRRITVRVPDEVDLKVEVELGDDKNELEIELTW